MQVGDLVKLTSIVTDHYMKLHGIVIRIDREGLHEVLWADGDRTKEFPRDLEVICK